MCPKTGGTAGIPAEIAAQYPISIPAGIPVGDFQPGLYRYHNVFSKRRENKNDAIQEERREKEGCDIQVEWIGFGNGEEVRLPRIHLEREQFGHRTHTEDQGKGKWHDKKNMEHRREEI